MLKENCAVAYVVHRYGSLVSLRVSYLLAHLVIHGRKQLHDAETSFFELITTRL